MTRFGFLGSCLGFLLPPASSGATGSTGTQAPTGSTGPTGRVVVAVSDARNGCFVPGTLVLVNGVDVSHICYRVKQFADGRGEAYCYLRAYEARSAKALIRDVGGDVELLADEDTVLSSHYRTYSLVGRCRISGWVLIVPPTSVSPDQWRALQDLWLRKECA